MNSTNSSIEQKSYNAVVKLKQRITPNLFILRVLPDAGIKDFKAGQYVAIGLVDPETLDRPKPKIIKRAYSIGSSPKNKDYLEFYISVVDEGALTPKLSKLEEGDRLFVAPKITGTFTLDEVPSDKNLILVSTGTGIAPYLSMLRTPLIWDYAKKIVIVHGVRYSADLGYREELEQLAETKGDKFMYFPLTSRNKSDGNVRQGYAQTVFIDSMVDLNPEVDHVFACGNPAMINDLQKYLIEDKNYTVHSRKQAGNFHIEKYW